jgi:hypothetical protein
MDNKKKLFKHSFLLFMREVFITLMPFFVEVSHFKIVAAPTPASTYSTMFSIAHLSRQVGYSMHTSTLLFP